MAEPTARRNPLSRRTMLVGKAGVLGGAASVASTAHVPTSAPASPAADKGAAPPSRFGDPAWWAKRNEKILEPALDSSPSRSSASAPPKIANAVVFFASDLAGFVNGQVLAVDGGK